MEKKLEHSHEPTAIRTRLNDKPEHNYLPDFIFGGIDGAISTLAIVAGVAGAGLSTRINIILGLASLVADGFSMATSNFLSTRSEVDKFDFYRNYELKQMEQNPAGETEEIRQIFSLKGFEGERLEHIVDIITNNKEQWLQIMLQEEYGLPKSVRSPWRAAISTFTAFLICGSVPLLPYLLGLDNPFRLACGLTGVTFFVIGTVKSRWSIYSWLRSGLSTLFIGSCAAFIAYGIGHWAETLLSKYL